MTESRQSKRNLGAEMTGYRHPQRLYRGVELIKSRQSKGYLGTEMAEFRQSQGDLGAEMTGYRHP